MRPLSYHDFAWATPKQRRSPQWLGQRANYYKLYVRDFVKLNHLTGLQAMSALFQGIYSPHIEVLLFMK